MPTADTPTAGYWQGKRVLVTGGQGFVGHAVLAALAGAPCAAVLAPSHAECDLTREAEVEALFDRARPDVVLHLAGRVGGIGANRAAPGEFFYQNNMMGTLVLEYARRAGVGKLVALAAGCGYPKYLQVPYREEDFWSGLPDENSIGYSMAKKMLIIQSWTYREQYGFNSVILLPANLYGPHDNFHLENAHVVPTLIRKFVEAAEAGHPEVTVWGSGTASREFLYVDDTAEAILRAAEACDVSGPLNLGTGRETTIRELVETIRTLTGYSGAIAWDRARPDGQPRRFYDMSKFAGALGYVPQTDLQTGLGRTIEWFRRNRQHFVQK